MKGSNLIPPPRRCATAKEVAAVGVHGISTIASEALVARDGELMHLCLRRRHGERKPIKCETAFDLQDPPV